MSRGNIPLLSYLDAGLANNVKLISATHPLMARRGSKRLAL
jgi:hypothetical protein